MSSRTEAEAIRNKIVAYLYDKVKRSNDDRYVTLTTLTKDLELQLENDRLRIVLDDLEFRGLVVGRNQPSKGKVLYQITPRGIDFIEEDPSKINSVEWTGADFQAVWNDEKSEKVVKEIRRIEEGLQELNLSNVQVSQIRSYITASVVIAESVNPDPDLIWEMLTRAGAVAGIAGLFFSVLTLLR